MTHDEIEATLDEWQQLNEWLNAAEAEAIRSGYTHPADIGAYVEAAIANFKAAQAVNRALKQVGFGSKLLE